MTTHRSADKKTVGYIMVSMVTKEPHISIRICIIPTQSIVKNTITYSVSPQLMSERTPTTSPLPFRETRTYFPKQTRAKPVIFY